MLDLKTLVFLSSSGLLILLLLFVFQTPQEITTLRVNNSNYYVTIAGLIINEKTYGEFKILKLKDEFGTLDITLNSKYKFTNKTVRVIGTIGTYQSKLQINAEKITLL